MRAVAYFCPSRTCLKYSEFVKKGIVVTVSTGHLIQLIHPQDFLSIIDSVLIYYFMFSVVELNGIKYVK